MSHTAQPTLYAASPFAARDHRAAERRRMRGDGNPLFWGSARKIQQPTLVVVAILVVGVVVALMRQGGGGGARVGAPWWGPGWMPGWMHAPQPPLTPPPLTPSSHPPRMPAQKTITLAPRAKGCHLVQDEIEHALRDELRGVQAGVLHLFILHTSAALSLNENVDPDVRRDLDMALDHVVPESLPWRHTDEGPDDSASHTKSALIGPSLMLPITGGRLHLGTWQGIYLCEFRRQRHTRRVVATVLP